MIENTISGNPFDRGEGFLPNISIHDDPLQACSTPLSDWYFECWRTIIPKYTIVARSWYHWNCSACYGQYCLDPLLYPIICSLFPLIVEIVLHINSKIASPNLRERMIENFIARIPHHFFDIVKINDAAWKAFTIRSKLWKISHTHSRFF